MQQNLLVRQGVFTGTIVRLFGDQLLSDWIWNLMHRREFVSVIVNLVM